MNLYPSALFHRQTRVCLKYFVRDCPFKHIFAFNSSQVPLNLGNSKAVNTSRKKKLKLVLLDNYFSDLSTEV